MNESQPQLLKQFDDYKIQHENSSQIQAKTTPKVKTTRTLHR